MTDTFFIRVCEHGYRVEWRNWIRKYQHMDSDAQYCEAPTKAIEVTSVLPETAESCSDPETCMADHGPDSYEECWRVENPDWPSGDGPYMVKL